MCCGDVLRNRLTFLGKLHEILGDSDTPSNLEKTSYVLGSELWVEKDFIYLLTVVTVDVWELRKQKLYGKDACPGPQSDSSGWDWGQDVSNGKRDKNYSCTCTMFICM